MSLKFPLPLLVISYLHCRAIGLIHFPITKSPRTKEAHDSYINAYDELDAVIKFGSQINHKTKRDSEDNSTILVHDRKLEELLKSRNCEVFDYNITLPRSSPMMSFGIEMEKNMTLFKCNRSLNVTSSERFFKFTDCPEYDVYYGDDLSGVDVEFLESMNECSAIQIPLRSEFLVGTLNFSDPFQFLGSEFRIKAILSEDCRQCYYERGSQCRIYKERIYCSKVNSFLGNVIVLWNPPPKGWFKLNSNGGIKAHSKKTGCGGVIRDMFGNWIYGYTKVLRDCSAFEAECWGMLCGLRIAWRLGVKKLFVESDSKILIGCLSKLENQKHYLIKVIQKLLQKDWEIEVLHIFREGNSCVDWLANHGITLQSGIHEFTVPSCRIVSAVVF